MPPGPLLAARLQIKRLVLSAGVGEPPAKITVKLRSPDAKRRPRRRVHVGHSGLGIQLICDVEGIGLLVTDQGAALCSLGVQRQCHAG